jgi:type II secretory ATPase GspE/PulE/Tfp pilus assembly ATPase PilB-like protein
LEELGISQYGLDKLKGEIKRPVGMILNTGPTGSGKTTTLYAVLKRVASEETKIITVEDPIEYKLPGITQTQVDRDANYTFANGLRSILRQDPDKVLVGEIRDLETAEIAVNAALTGHLVFSTLHTNDAAGAVPRLMDLGVNGTTLAPAFNAAIAQRLVRVLCPKCKQKKPISPELKKRLEEWLGQVTPQFPYMEQYMDSNGLKVDSLYYPKGCQACNDIGYKGRVAIFEILVFDDELRKLITGMVSSDQIREAGVKKGLVLMSQDGVFKALEGQTSLEEVSRVTDLAFFQNFLEK